MLSKLRINAFTLIEILLALTIGGMLLTAISVYLVSLANIWFIRGDDQYFNQHVEGVTYFLNHALKNSVTSQEAELASISWNRPPGFSEFEDPLLTFRLKEAPALLALPDQQFTAITCHLYFRKGYGLFMLWYSNLQKTEDSDDVQRTLVSPLLSNIRYCYYKSDDDKWEIHNTPQEDRSRKLIIPDFLFLDFEYEGELRETPLQLPNISGNISIF